MTSVVRVLVDSPVPRLDRLLDYSVPERLRSHIVVGARVKVPLGRGSRFVDAFVVEAATESKAGVALTDIEDVLGSTPVLTPNMWRLARAVAERNGGSTNDVLRAAIPKRAVRADKDSGISPHSLTTSEAGPRRILALDAGVDGSGEHLTRRGFQMIAGRVKRVLDSGRTALVVVPDWRDLELMVRAVAPLAPTIRWDSSGTPSQRYTRYLEVLSGRARIVVGTRSAIYAPLVNLGLIVVVDESDPLLTEPIAPYANARDVALLRNGFEGCELIFASFAPSVDSARYLDLGFAESDGHIPQRPAVILANDPVDAHSAHARIPSSVWRHITTTLHTKPVLLVVARPGFTPQIICTRCRTVHRCARCKAIMGASRTGAPSCRLCGYTPTRFDCAQCHGKEWAPSGVGSERTAFELGKAFPGVKVVVSDAEHRTLEIPDRPALVIATRGAEPIAEGGYGLVAILDADRELHNPSLRTTENCLRWWASAAALVADDASVILAHVSGAFGTQFATGQWENIVNNELRERRVLGFPPVTRTMTITGDIAELSDVRARIADSSRTILGPTRTEKSHRLVVLADFAHHHAVVSEIRAYIVAQSTTSIRLHCDDMSVFDSFDED
ncbi:replication restart DNA helicase PriA [Microbacteriaceae bacterium MWH-Ta3]|nr:replication restart DNA helicase PriA [Microbacteriaceae bacterium MWH-Ta3]